jgi:hypothetical protein
MIDVIHIVVGGGICRAAIACNDSENGHIARITDLKENEI